MPGHFLVGDRVTGSVYVDVFAGGVILDRDGCESLYAGFAGSRPFDPAFLEPTEPVDIVRRILANLRGVYRSGGDVLALRWVLDLVCRLPDVGSTDHADHAAVLAWTGRDLAAVRAYTAAAEASADDSADEYLRRARALRARLN